MSSAPPTQSPPGRLTALVRRLIMVWLVVICFDGGCSARCAGSSAARASRERQVKLHVFRKTRAEVFEAARAVVALQGYTLKRPAKVDNAVYESDWRENAGEQQALSVKIHKRLTGGVKLEIQLLMRKQGQAEVSRRRLYDEELEVIKRLEPVKARAIELMAEAHRRTAEEGARGCGCAESCTLPGCESCHACQTCTVAPRAPGGTR